MGMSGVGKTAVAHEVGRVMNDRGSNFVSWAWMQKSDFLSHSKLKRHTLPLLYAVKSLSSLKVLLILLKLILLILLKLGPWRLSRTDLVLCLNTLRIYVIQNFLIRRNKADIYLFDESVWNSVFSRIDSHKLDPVLKDMVNIILWKDLTTIFIFAGAPADIAINRLISAGKTANGSEESREGLRQSEEARNIYRDMLKNYIENKKKIVGILEKTNTTPFINIDTRKPREENANIIFQFLQNNL